ncbi:MAG TPA: DUF1302 domain-containing protein [Opitutaceae bacterium]|nr:DUF1302 domain-containing protein [Opitutaceae bacterium]
MHSSRIVCVFHRGVAAILCGIGALALLTPVRAFQFSEGDLKGSFDSTLSFGGLYRLQDPSSTYYGISSTFNGVAGQQNSVNADDGNLNYSKGWVSELLKGSHDLELKYHNFGALVRGYWFYDYKADSTLRTTLSSQAVDRVVRGGDWLDMYTRAEFTLPNGMPLDVRLGRQVLSLGESTFLPNGINVVNPADLTKLRAPGSELKEALLPVNMLNVSLGVTENITIEPFWLLEFRRNELEPAGSCFSTNDFATRGGDTVWLGFGSIPDRGSTLGGIPRDRDREHGNYNQYGVALRAMAPGLHDTEFGFYFARYHSRSPLVSARTPSGGISATLVQTTATTLAQQSLAPAMIAAGYPAAGVPGALGTLLGAALTGVPQSALPASLQPFYPAAQQIAAGAGKIGLLSAAATGRYFDDYPAGISMYGVSFNTSLGNTGISWQGEVSYKDGVPLQVDDVELLFAALSTLAPQFGANNQLGNYLGQYNTEIAGYRRHSVWTAQTTLTKVFGPMLGAQQFTLLGEVGGVWANLPGKDTLRYDAPGTFTAGSQAEMNGTGFPQFAATPNQAFADKFSWGYAVLGRLEYNNLLPNITTTPTVAFTHDVGGNTPLPLANYVKDRMSITASVEFSYRNAWALELRYVNFFGGGRYNLLGDRDYVASTIKYSF